MAHFFFYFLLVASQLVYLVRPTSVLCTHLSSLPEAPGQTFANRAIHCIVGTLRVFKTDKIEPLWVAAPPVNFLGCTLLVDVLVVTEHSNFLRKLLSKRIHPVFEGHRGPDLSNGLSVP
jgi:hypothetical protein